MDAQKRGLFVKSKRPITPPYFSAKFDCAGCFAPCVSACDKGLLSYVGEKIEFKVVELGCNFCEECAKTCESVGKTTLSLKFDKIIAATAVIDTNSCLAWNETMCFNCLDMCKFKAIEFFGVFRPIINDRCVGCGECLVSCFKHSISLKSI